MKICVIGSGVFGIAAVREIGRVLPESSVHWVSEDQEAGGLWSPSSKRSLVYDSLFLNTSRERSAFAGTSIRADPSVHYVHHSCYSAYLAEVAAECTKAERHWQCRVTSVAARDGGGWVVRWQTPDGAATEADFDAVVDATGHNGEPRGPAVPLAEERDYAYTHSSDYRDAAPYRGKNVLVIGNGASALDIACELVTVASRVGVSIRTPKWHLPKMLLGKPIDQSPDGWWQHAPVIGRIASAVAESIVRRVMGSYRLYGLEDPATPLAASIPVLSDHFLAHLSHGRLHLYRQVVALEEGAVRFADGGADKFDAVIAATGFRDSSPHLPAEVQSVLSGGRLGVAFELPGFPALHLMNRFRCGDAAVRCAEVQAAAVTRSLARSTTHSTARSTTPSARVLQSAATAPRITARILREAYEAYV